IEIVGLGKACQLIHENLPEYQSHMTRMRDQLESGLLDRFPDSRLNGHPENRLPNTSSISFKNLEANRILDGLTSVAASAGAACHSDRVEVSSVLEAMNVPMEYAMGTIRFSVGRFTTSSEIELATAEISKVINELTLAHTTN
ncbi:MAG TPA: aminotransferase class V-fold PLP-dependent enzyme, partial [Dehalococcoidia bacterium]|nr:aminotransferase class V-fold PLP-dependent enzyme [Dehalococcoidia bacterium]